MFTIVNNSPNTVGPYGTPQTTIATGSSFTVNPPVNSYVADTNLLSDVMNAVVSIQIGESTQLPWSIAVTYLQNIYAKNLNSYKNITGNVTVTVKSSTGILNWITVNNNTTGGTVKIYDSISASGALIATMTLGTPSGGLLSTSGQSGPDFFGPLNLEFTNGLTIVTSGSSNNDITVIYQ